MVPEITPGKGMPAVRGAAVLPRLEMNLPNLITLARLLSVPLAVWLIVDGRYDLAFWVFIGAGASDGLDGYIAKRFDRRTRLGALLDPAADKILLASVYVTLGLAGQLPVWLVALVLLRDVLIVLGFLVIQTTAAPRPLAPLAISKANTLVQLALVGFVLAQGIGIESEPLKWLLVYAAGAATLASGVSYLVRMARILTRSEQAW